MQPVTTPLATWEDLYALRGAAWILDCLHERGELRDKMLSLTLGSLAHRLRQTLTTPPPPIPWKIAIDGQELSAFLKVLRRKMEEDK